MKLIERITTNILLNMKTDYTECIRQHRVVRIRIYMNGLPQDKLHTFLGVTTRKGGMPLGSG